MIYYTEKGELPEVNKIWRLKHFFASNVFTHKKTWAYKLLREFHIDCKSSSYSI